MAKLLLVEDDDSTVFLLKSALEGARYSVEVASNGEDGLYFITNYVYDMAILDWDLPKISGLSVLQQYRRQGGKIPVLFLTGKDSLDNIEEGLDAGADDYLVKPFAWRELLSRVRALLRRLQDQKTTELHCGPIKIDPVTGVVTAYDTNVRLTAQDFALLEFLMRHQDQLFSVEALLERAWKADSSATGSAVRTAFMRLRKALSINGQRVPILNIRAQGYKMVSSWTDEASQGETDESAET